MIQKSEGPPRGGADGPEVVCLAANASNITQNPAPSQVKFRNPRAVREAKLELLRDAVHEACGFIRLHAEVCQTLAEAGDDAGLLHSLGRLITYTKHAARTAIELRETRGGTS
jgi:hypothetical protein